MAYEQYMKRLEYHWTSIAYSIIIKIIKIEILLAGKLFKNSHEAQ